MTEPIHTRCCIAGGGPAGMMLGFLLARMGVDVVVLEKHGDFLRDFRGDTIHPSTLEVIAELGLLELFLRRPHDEVEELAGQIGGETLTIADFRHLPTRCRFIALMPQWDFLDFLSVHGSRYQGFRLMMEATATGLIERDGRIVGVRAATKAGEQEILADLVVGADGRHSTLRALAGLKVKDLGAPMDVFWMRITRRGSDPEQTFGHIEPGRIFVMLNRRDYWQCAFVIPKGSAESVRARGLDAFRAEIAGLSPFLADRVRELGDWDQVKLLTVAVDRLERWYRPGLMCIGDAAHAMSPIGGIGINLAIQDAVAASNILGPPLLAGTLADAHLARLQRRRELPTRLTQGLQVLLQRRVIGRVLARNQPIAPPAVLRLVQRFPILRRLPARLVGMGFRPEHVLTPEARAAPRRSVAENN
ncbi:MAG: FAD-dependent oxidoreductase [Proteobacteria bacterium]|nr:FAD-dependent oxidoreductase [Pseudomonadota bacterium]